MKKWIASMMAILLFIALLHPLATYANENQGKRVVAYFPNWGTYGSHHQNMSVGDIPWDKVTHINHAFFTVDSSFKIASTDSFADFEKTFPHSEGWSQPNRLAGHMGEYKYYKSVNPNVKLFISVGGWTRGQNFHAMAKTSASRKIFIDSVIDFLNTYPFVDGIDIDWEYPGVDRPSDPYDQYDYGCPGGPEDGKNFTLLLKELREAYNRNNLSNKLLTIAAPASMEKVQLTNPTEYSKYLDFINVMTYDMHGAWEQQTNHQSAIYKSPEDPTKAQDLTTEEAMKIFTDTYGIAAGKLNVGTPFYSRGWAGVSANTGKDGLYASTTSYYRGSWDLPSHPQPGGQVPYYELKRLETTSGWSKFRDPYAKVPYLYNASRGIMLSYEDATSLTERSRLIRNEGYGGLVIWQLTGDIKNEGFPMTSLAFDLMRDGKPLPAPEPTPEPTPPTDPGTDPTPQPVPPVDETPVPPTPTPEPTPNPVPGSGNFQFDFKVTSSWGSGFIYDATLTNNTTETLNEVKLTFELNQALNTAWSDMQLVDKNGTTYTFTPASWITSLAPGQTLRFGGSGVGSGNGASPFNIRVNDVLISDGSLQPDPNPGTPTDPQPPTEPTVPTEPTEPTTPVDPDPVDPVEPKPIPTNGDMLPANEFPTHAFAPYVDVTLWQPKFDMAELQGVNNFVLAFIVTSNDGKKNPAWGGYSVYDMDFQKDKINKVRQNGGEVMVSLGGANNIPLASSITSASELKEVYGNIIDSYKLKYIDFDIEGTWVADQASINRRSDALLLLQQDPKYKDVEIWYTLPVLPTGLDHNGIRVLQDAVNKGVNLAGVNIMAMEYGNSHLPNHPSKPGDLGQLGIQAMNSLFNQLKQSYNAKGISKSDKALWEMVGITPMFGQNNNRNEVFTKEDAKVLKDYAKQQGIGLLSMWSLERDQPGAKGVATFNHSGLSEADLTFTHLFSDFESINGSSPKPTPIPTPEPTPVPTPTPEPTPAPVPNPDPQPVPNPLPTPNPAPSQGAEWAVNTSYHVGDEVVYEGVKYQCLQAHTSITTWNPLDAISLWKKSY